tara:strand:+ start:492 stop:866 length:375 start_codon:yes stop_codon:yes gene_type:complete
MSVPTQHFPAQVFPEPDRTRHGTVVFPDREDIGRGCLHSPIYAASPKICDALESVKNRPNFLRNEGHDLIFFKDEHEDGEALAKKVRDASLGIKDDEWWSLTEVRVIEIGPIAKTHYKVHAWLY